MKYSLELASPTPTGWVKTVLADFPAFLQDHADCERKASAMAMSFVAKYPDRVDIIPELIATAIEELGHFQQVYAHMQKRHIRLAKEMLALLRGTKSVFATQRTERSRRENGSILGITSGSSLADCH